MTSRLTMSIINPFPQTNLLTFDSGDKQNESPLLNHPEEIIQNIFASCTPSTIIQLQISCKKAYRIANDSHLWKNLFIKHSFNTLSMEKYSISMQQQCKLSYTWEQNSCLNKIWENNEVKYIGLISPHICLFMNSRGILKALNLKNLEIEDLFNGCQVIDYRIKGSKIYAQLSEGLLGIWPNKKSLFRSSLKFKDTPRSPKQPGEHTILNEKFESFEKLSAFFQSFESLNPSIFYVSDNNDRLFIGYKQGEIKGWCLSSGRCIFDVKEINHYMVNFISLVNEILIVGYKHDHRIKSYHLIDLRNPSHKVIVEDCSFCYIHDKSLIFVDKEECLKALKLDSSFKEQILYTPSKHLKESSYSIHSSTLHHDKVIFLCKNYFVYTLDLSSYAIDVHPTMFANPSHLNDPLKLFGHIELKSTFVIIRTPYSLIAYDITTKKQTFIKFHDKAEVKLILVNNEGLLIAAPFQIHLLYPSRPSICYDQDLSKHVISSFSDAQGTYISYSNGKTLLIPNHPLESSFITIEEPSAVSLVHSNVIHDYFIRVFDNFIDPAVLVKITHSKNQIALQIKIDLLFPTEEEGSASSEWMDISDPEEQIDFEWGDEPSLQPPEDLRPSSYSTISKIYNHEIFLFIYNKCIVYNLIEKKVSCESFVNGEIDEIIAISADEIAFKNCGKTQYIYNRNEKTFLYEPSKKMEFFECFHERFLLQYYSDQTLDIYDTESLQTFSLKFNASEAEIRSYLDSKAILLQKNHPLNILDLTKNLKIDYPISTPLIDWKFLNEKEALLVFQNGFLILLNLYNGKTTELRIENAVLNDIKIVSNDHQIIIAYPDGGVINFLWIDVENLKILKTWEIPYLKHYTLHTLNFEHFYIINNLESPNQDPINLIQYQVKSFSENFSDTFYLSSGIDEILWQNDHHILFSTLEGIFHYNSHSKEIIALWDDKQKRITKINQCYVKEPHVFLEILFDNETYSPDTNSAWYAFNSHSLKWKPQALFESEIKQKKDHSYVYQEYKLSWKNKIFTVTHQTQTEDPITHTFLSGITHVNILGSNAWILAGTKLYRFNISDKRLDYIDECHQMKICGPYLMIINYLKLKIYKISGEDKMIVDS